MRPPPWDKNLGGTRRQTDKQTDRTVYRVASQLKISSGLCYV